MNIRSYITALLPAALLVLAAAPAAANPDLDAFHKAALPCPAEATLCVGVHLHVVVHEDQTPTRPPAWFADQLAQANRLFASIGVGFELASVDALPAEAAEVRTRDDRDRLGRKRYSRGGVHVFLVHALADVDVEGEVIRGVHWRDRARRGHRWIILSSIAPNLVLAHELGHFFSLPHSDYPISIMNKTPRDTPPYEERAFDPKEIAIMKRQARLMRNTRELTHRPPQ